MLSLVWTYRRRWIVSTVLFGLVGLAYALLNSPNWEASQALVVRNEAHGGSGTDRPGKFGHIEELKAAQETILELAKGSSVLEAALVQVGPDREGVSADWPTVEDVADLRDSVKISPPNGNVFGKTEVFYLKVTAKDRSRARRLADAIVDQLQARFQRLLDDKAASMIAELQKTAELADADLDRSTKALGQLERQVGSDLSELRILHEIPSGNSDLRQKVVAVENELRNAQTNHHDSIQLIDLLKAAREDDTQLVAVPDRLLKSHATLSRLIEGLSAARLRTSSLLGNKSAQHPQVLAAKAEEAEVLANLRTELASAIPIAAVEARLDADRVARLTRHRSEVEERLNRLAALRADYANLVAQSKSRTVLAEEARRNLAEARASQAAARSASLIARIDAPDTGSRPLGPGRSLMVLFGVAGGFVVGLGIVFVTVPAVTPVASDAYEVPHTWQPQGTSVESLIKSQGPLSLKQALSKVARGGRN
ncbi:MAG: hypothetical protein WD468_05920 [Pirellulales bacterium]